MGSADMIAVVMNAQRGSGGFIFLALPFFILAGYIMDRADVGGRIVEFIASLIGHVRGGLLQVMIVGVYISSCISGIEGRGHGDGRSADEPQARGARIRTR